MSESESDYPADEEVDGCEPTNKTRIINAIRRLDDLTKVENLFQSTHVDVCLDSGQTDYTALHFAAHFNRPAIVKKLLDMKADVRKEDKNGNTPVNIAASLGHERVISTIVEHDPECVLLRDRKFTSMPIHTASRQGHFNVVLVLMKHHLLKYYRRQQLEAKTNKDEQTPLHLAAMYGHVKIVEFLLENCSKLKVELKNLKNKYHGETPVHAAAFKGRVEVIKVMVVKYPDCLQYQDDYNGTPFLAACGFGHVQLVEKLINDHNADIQGDSLALATDALEPAVTSLDEPDSGNVQQSKQLSQLPLVRACKYGRTMIVRLLFDKGVNPVPQAIVKSIKGGFSETAKELLVCSGSKWKKFMEYTYEGEDGGETTPFRELVRHMPDVAEIVLNKCMEVEIQDGRRYVTFCYDFIEDFASCTTSNGYESIAAAISTWDDKPKGFSKENHPLFLMVKHKRHDLLSHPLITSLIHYKWKSFGWILLLPWIIFLIHLSFVTALTLVLSHPMDNECVDANMTSNEKSPPSCDHKMKSVLLKILATETIAYSSISLMVRVILVFLSLKNVCSMKDKKETNPLYHLQDLISCLVNWPTITEVSLFILSLIYAFPVYWLDKCLCPFSWQLAIGAVVILLTWLEFIILSIQFQVIGVYILMLSRVFVSYLKTSVLLCLLISGFGLVFYLSLNDPHVAGLTYLTPGLALLKVTEETVGKDFNSFVHASNVHSLKEYSHSALTFIFWIIFIIIMPILFTNLLIGLAVGDIQALFKVANFEKSALQVDQILSIEDYLHSIGFKPKKPKSNKLYDKYSVCEMLVNRLIVLLWGGECFDSLESNRLLLEHQQTFKNSHRMAPS